MGDIIKSIEAIPVGLPFTQHEGQPAGFGGKVWKTLDNLLVRVEATDGIVGWGDAFAYDALTPYFGPGLLATLQMAAVFPSVEYIEIFGATLKMPLFDDCGLPGQDQKFVIPTSHGLGADPTAAEVIEPYRLD